jgi:hypothetical protein
LATAGGGSGALGAGDDGITRAVSSDATIAEPTHAITVVSSGTTRGRKFVIRVSASRSSRRMIVGVD